MDGQTGLWLGMEWKTHEMKGGVKSESFAHIRPLSSRSLVQERDAVPSYLPTYLHSRQHKLKAMEVLCPAE